MTRIFTFLMMWTFITTSIMAQKHLYVSKGANASDANTGTEAKPLATIEHALQRLNNEGGGVLIIKEGRYKPELILSGYKDITIEAQDDAEVIIDGTTAIDQEWKKETMLTNIYSTKIPFKTWQLFIDNQQQINARWPNAKFEDQSIFDHHKWAKGDDNMTLADGEMNINPTTHNLSALPFSIKGAMMVGNIGSYTSTCRLVTAHTIGENKFFYNKTGYNKKKHQYLFIEGLKELIDAPNEWCYNQKEKKLYVYGDPSGREIKAKTISYSFDFNKSTNIKIKGIKFFATTIQAIGCTDFTVESCTFSYPSCSKRMLRDEGAQLSTKLQGKGVRGYAKNTLRKCLIEHTDGTGLILNGTHNTVDSCYFQYIDYTCAAIPGPGATINTKGSHLTFTHNTVHTTGASEMLVMVPNSLIAFNEVWNTGLCQNDGAIMAFGRGAPTNSRIHHNWLHDTRKGGIRFDAPMNMSPMGGKHGTIDHNMLWNCGVGLMVKGDFHHVFNNTVLNTKGMGMIIINESMIDPKTKKTIYSNRNSSVCNNLAYTISGHRRNRYVDDPIKPSHVLVKTFESNIFNKENESHVDPSSLISNPRDYDFTPKASATQVINKGVEDKTSPFTLTAGSVNKPDIGAYEFGATPWTAGARWKPDFFPWNQDKLTFSISNNTILEGQVANITVKVNQAISSTMKVKLGITDITTTESDFNHNEIEITFPPYSRIAKVNIATHIDKENERDEVFEIKVKSNSLAKAFITKEGVVTIRGTKYDNTKTKSGFIWNPDFDLLNNYTSYWNIKLNNKAKNTVCILNDATIGSPFTDKKQLSIDIIDDLRDNFVKLESRIDTLFTKGSSGIDVEVKFSLKTSTKIGESFRVILYNNGPLNNKHIKNQIISNNDWNQYSYKFQLDPQSEPFKLNLVLELGKLKGTSQLDNFRSKITGDIEIGNNSLKTSSRSLSTKYRTTIYPSPAKDLINIFSTFNNLTKIKIINLDGKLRLTKKVINSSSQTLNVATLARGIYVLELMYKDGTIDSQKIILQ
ncbi:T9SS type A sorting domain-containing protein [Halosquirtibacter xylanolyticus]|uniref:T9SS type A sorting domain-containing protein n=1 Tax=Halosquirtibacter xylanolyticus TaxID=3374599 RepID=UPI0037488746|nr:T9SS type A sorting domain-containing protein [Prolixibacteraceae bacterium]